MINGKKVALVLSGGAALGFAHIGVLQALEENGIIPDIICGNSAGAIVGGAYISGISIDDIKRYSLLFNRNQVIDLKLFPLFTNSLLRSAKIDNFLQKLYKNKLIEKQKIKFGAVAVDMNTGDLVEMRKGLVWEAVRASISVPGIFTPVEKDGRKLIDGGIVDNLPTGLALKMGADYIIAVNVINYDNILLEPRNLIHTLVNCMNISQKELLRVKTKCDTFIQMDLKGVSMGAFKKSETQISIDSGYKETCKHIKKIKKDLDIK